MNITPEQIHLMATELVADRGIENLTKETLCQHLGIPEGSFEHYAGVPFKPILQGLIEVNTKVIPPPSHRTRMHPMLRKQQVLDAAIRCAEDSNYLSITRTQVAEEAEVSNATVSRYYPTMRILTQELMLKALDTSNVPIVAQGLAAEDKFAQGASLVLRERCATWVRGERQVRV